MGSFFVVIQSPDPRHFSDLINSFKQVSIQELAAKRTIKAFDEAILLWFARLDVNHFDIVRFAPIRQRRRYQFRAVAQLLGQSALGLKLL